jgi:hypothetical protein
MFINILIILGLVILWAGLTFGVMQIIFRLNNMENINIGLSLVFIVGMPLAFLTFAIPIYLGFMLLRF